MRTTTTTSTAEDKKSRWFHAGFRGEMRHLRPADSFFAHCAKISPTTNGGPVGARIVDEVDGLFRFGVCDEALLKANSSLQIAYLLAKS